MILGGGLAGLGIANETSAGEARRGRPPSALVPFVLILADDRAGSSTSRLLIYAIFPIAQFALLVHPQSREYQRIWFLLGTLPR